MESVISQSYDVQKVPTLLLFYNVYAQGMHKAKKTAYLYKGSKSAHDLTQAATEACGSMHDLMYSSKAIRENQNDLRFTFYKTAPLLPKPVTTTVKPGTSLRVNAKEPSQGTTSNREFSLWLALGILFFVLVSVVISTIVRYVAFSKDVHDSDDEDDVPLINRRYDCSFC